VTAQRVQVMLDDDTIERAKALGDGNVSRGSGRLSQA
jgi:post-segregation antitoxin (ccd killing protein)